MQLGLVGYDVEYHERDDLGKVVQNVGISRNRRAFRCAWQRGG